MSNFALTPRSGLEQLLRPATHGAITEEPGVVVALRTNLALAYVMVRKGKAEDLRQRVQDRFGKTLPMTAQRAEKNWQFEPQRFELYLGRPREMACRNVNANRRLTRGDAPQ